jgi:lipoprotein-releasing system permease protein
MNLSFYIARRYFRSKKSYNIINIISGISVAGVMVGTFALVIVLSVFNGFEELVVSLLNSFNPDLQITVREGKTFSNTDISTGIIREIPGVKNLTEVIEENALMRYKDNQYIVTMKGVGPEFASMTGLDTMMTDGKFLLQDGPVDFALLGYGVAYYLKANLRDPANPITVFVPGRSSTPGMGLDQGFNQDVIFPSGFFSIQQDYDVKYVVLPLRFVKKLLEYDKEITAIEVSLSPGADPVKIQKQVEKVAGPGFVVKNRFQQQEFLYNIMKTEKWAIFTILTFILLIATFNVVGSLTMLIIDKKKDIAVLQSLGAGKKLIRRIFMTEGLMISFTGAILGIILGIITCWLQQQYGLVRLGPDGSTFIVSAYPVSMKTIDIAAIFFTVMAIGYLAAWYPVYNIRRISTSLVKYE